MVKTLPCHGKIPGSIPGGAAMKFMTVRDDVSQTTLLEEDLHQHIDKNLFFGEVKIIARFDVDSFEDAAEEHTKLYEEL